MKKKVNVTNINTKIQEQSKVSVQDFVDDIFNKGENRDLHITRQYVPISEKNEIIENILLVSLSKIVNEEIIEGEYELYTNIIVDELLIKCDILSAYTDIDLSDKELVYDTLSKDGLLDATLELIGNDAKILEDMFYRRKSDKMNFIKENKKSSIDIFLDELLIIISDFSESLDFKNLLPALDNLAKMKNPSEKEIVNAIVNKNQSKINRLLGHKKSKKKVKVDNDKYTDGVK